MEYSFFSDPYILLAIAMISLVTIPVVWVGFDKAAEWDSYSSWKYRKDYYKAQKKQPRTSLTASEVASKQSYKKVI